MSFAPRVFCRVCLRVLCCYRTDHVVSASVPSGTLLLLLVRHYFSFCFLQKFFNTQTTKEVRMQKWRKLRSACFPALPTGRVDERCVGKRQQAMTKMGVKVHLCQIAANVKRALLRLPRQCRLNRHLLKRPQPTAVTQRVLLSLIAILNCLPIEKSLVRWRSYGFVTPTIKILFNNKKNVKH